VIEQAHRRGGKGLLRRAVTRRRGRGEKKKGSKSVPLLGGWGEATLARAGPYQKDTQSQLVALVIGCLGQCDGGERRLEVKYKRNASDGYHH
jgi:hypothetical protein